MCLFFLCLAFASFLWWFETKAKQASIIWDYGLKRRLINAEILNQGYPKECSYVVSEILFFIH